MNNLIPENIKKFANSPDIYISVEKIGGIFGLHIDQLGELDAEIRSIILGINESSDFIKHISERLEIDKDLAEKIAVEVNKEIFSVLKAQMQSENKNSSGYNTESNINALEQAGRFEIVKDGVVEDGTRVSATNITAGYTTPKTNNNVENIQADNLLKASSIPKSKPIQPNNIPKIVPKEVVVNPIQINQTPTYTKPNPVPPIANFVPIEKKMPMNAEPIVNKVEAVRSVPFNKVPENIPSIPVPPIPPIQKPILQTPPVIMETSVQTPTPPILEPVAPAVSEIPTVQPTVSPIQQSNKPYMNDPYREPI
jgi:hypothetical protein